MASEKSFEIADNDNHNNAADNDGLVSNGPRQHYLGHVKPVSLPNKQFLDWIIEKRLTNTVHMLSPDTDSCPFWNCRYDRTNVENISWSISSKECCRPGGYQTHDLQITTSNAHPTESPRLAPTTTNNWILMTLWASHEPFRTGVLKFHCLFFFRHKAS